MANFLVDTTNPLGRLRPPYRPPLIEHEIASQPPYTRDERIPTASPSLSTHLLQPRYQPVLRDSSPASVHSDSTVEWDVSAPGDYDTQAASAGISSTEKHVTTSAVAPLQTNLQEHIIMAHNTRGRPPGTPNPQQDHLSVTPSAASAAERFKTKTKHAADINASFKKAEADLDVALGRKGPPSNKAGKKVWDKYLEDAMAHLGVRSLERNRWEQLEALEAEQTRMRGETFQFVGTGADEADDAEVLIPSRTKNLRQRRIPAMPPPATTDGPRKSVNGTGARHNPQKPALTQLLTKGVDVLEAFSDAKLTKAKQPRDERPDTDNKQGSAKKKRFTEDLSSSLGAAWDAHVDMAGHRPRRTNDKL
ncbi:hypothetical protein MN608_09775 [Microdochium nivale]|nr:hypothetical protein MN608_09775 [Microdochium nivale]